MTTLAPIPVTASVGPVVPPAATSHGEVPVNPVHIDIDTTATGQAGTNTTGTPRFQSHTIAVLKGLDVIALDMYSDTAHDNIVDSKVWDVARRVIATALTLIILPFVLIADAVRGIAYNLPKGWKLHNSGTLHPTIAKMASKVSSILEPTKNFYKAVARAIAARYASAGKAVDEAKPNSSQPKNIINSSIDRRSEHLGEACELARHFEGLSYEQRAAGLEMLRQELKIETRTAPHYYPDKMDTTKGVYKVYDAMERINTALLGLAVEASTDANGVVDRTALAEAVLLASIGPDGKVNPLTRNRRIEDLKSQGVIPADVGTPVNAGGSTPNPATRTGIPAAGVRSFADDVQDLEASLEANEAEVTANGAEPKAKTTEKPGNGEKIEELNLAAQAKAIQGQSNNYNNANNILARIIQLQGQRRDKLLEIQMDFTTRTALVPAYRKKKTEILTLLRQEGYSTEDIVEAMVQDDSSYNKRIAEVVKPLKDLRKKMTDEKQYKHLSKEVQVLDKQIKNLIQTFGNVTLPDQGTFVANTSTEQKEIVAHYIAQLATYQSYASDTSLEDTTKAMEVARNQIGMFMTETPAFKAHKPPAAPVATVASEPTRFAADPSTLKALYLNQARTPRVALAPVLVKAASLPVAEPKAPVSLVDAASLLPQEEEAPAPTTVNAASFLPSESKKPVSLWRWPFARKPVAAA